MRACNSARHSWERQLYWQFVAMTEWFPFQRERFHDGRQVNLG